MPARSTTSASFQSDVLQNDLLVLVDFWAPWCPPCRAVGPVLDELADDQAGELEVIKVNIDENPELARKYSVASIPAFRVFKEGDVVGSFMGAMPKKAFEQKLDPYMVSASK